MGKPILGVTLVELLLVVALMAVIAPITYPLALQMLTETNDQPVANLVRESVSHANSMGLIGRDKESQLSFESGKSSFSRADKAVSLPDGYEIGDIYLDGEKESAADIKFKLSGKIVANNTEIDKLVVEVKRGGTVLESVEATSRSVTDESWKNDPSRLSSSTRCSLL
ncbi:MAG: hypothetical protein PHQ02_02250 [Candidatus Riflebacteria bacterium]|nr:hypothetical protein [Candidatus Riflebacteria bacterium]